MRKPKRRLAVAYYGIQLLIWSFVVGVGLVFLLWSMTPQPRSQPLQHVPLQVIQEILL